MNTVTLDVSSIDEAQARLAVAFREEPQGQRISFASVDLLWKVISSKRWDIIRTMTGQGPLAIRKVAHRLDRDVKGVHGDMLALINADVIDRTENGVVFPYYAVHVDFMLKAASSTRSNLMKIVKSLLITSSLLCAFSSYAIAQNNTQSSTKGTIIPVRQQILQMDRNLAKAGGVPPSVLKIDEELLTIPIGSPKAAPLEKRKQAAMDAHSAAVHQGLEKAQAERALYPPTRSYSQPAEQGQRMCSVNNGSATYLTPC